MSRTLVWVLTVWQHCLSGSGKNSPPRPRLWSFSKGSAPFLTPSPSPDVGSTAQRDQVDLV